MKKKALLILIRVIVILLSVSCIAIINQKFSLLLNVKKIYYYNELTDNNLMKEYLREDQSNSFSYKYLQSKINRISIKKIANINLIDVDSITLLVLQKSQGAEAAKIFYDNIRYDSSDYDPCSTQKKLEKAGARIPEEIKKSLLTRFDEDEMDYRNKKTKKDYALRLAILPKEKFIEKMVSSSNIYDGIDNTFEDFIDANLCDDYLSQIAIRIQNMSVILRLELDKFLDEKQKISLIDKEVLLSEKLSFIATFGLNKHFTYKNLIKYEVQEEIESMNSLIGAGFIKKNEAINILKKKSTQTLIKYTPYTRRTDYLINVNEYYLIVVNSIKSLSDYQETMEYLREQEAIYERNITDIMQLLKLKYMHFEEQRITNK